MAKERNRGAARREIPVREVSHFSRNDQQIRRRIAEKAYELYECRGCCHGQDLEDWLKAERMVLTELEKDTESDPTA